MKIGTPEEITPCVGDFILRLNSIGKPFIQELIHVNGPFDSIGAGRRMEIFTVEHKFKTNISTENVLIIKH